MSGRGIDEAAELRASRRRLVLAADAERRAIERALHDGLQQQLVGLAADLELVSASVGSDPEAATALLVGIRRDVGRALEDARALAHRIHPALEAGGLGPALRLAASHANVRARIDVDVGPSAPAEITGAVYFCCLDIMARTEATTTAIMIRERNDAVSFELAADGEAAGTATALRDRVEALGGTLEVRSEPGRGAVFVGAIPLGR